LEFLYHFLAMVALHYGPLQFYFLFLLNNAQKKMN